MYICIVMEKIILGIDPGTNLMGYGVLKVLDNKAQMITMGVIDLRKFSDAYMKLGHIYERVTGIIDSYLPDEMAIEAPFFGKNVQSMLIKMAITGQGQASKEQVAAMLQRILKINERDMCDFMDATDALGAAYCHFLQLNRPVSQAHYRGWKDFVNKNQERICKNS